MNQRPLYKQLWNQLAANKAMIMLAGPRQAGKTTFAREIIAQDFKDTVYFNWDIPEHKRRLISDPSFFSKHPRVQLTQKPLVIFDEIHKYRHWKNYLKGVYDQFSREYQFLVTGSGRLEFSRKAGDSLAGRFLKFHLFPFTLAELAGSRRDAEDFFKDPLTLSDAVSVNQSKKNFESLYELSGFPEPFIKGKKDFWRIWSSSYSQQIIRDDLRTLADIRNLDTVEILYALLPSRVANPLSMNNLAQELQVAFDTVKNWLLLFDSFYLTFRIAPWTAKISRSILKEKKLYLFNFPVIEDEGSRFENMVAVELLRAVENWNDSGVGTFGLYYLRNKDQQETDFILTKSGKPFLLIEVKLTEDQPSPALMGFQQRLKIPAVQLVKKEGIKKYIKNDSNMILLVTAHLWLSGLP